MAEVDLVTIAASLHARRGTAAIVPYERRDLAWRPTPNDCHNNTDRFVLENAGYKSVRGWRVLDRSATLDFFASWRTQSLRIQAASFSTSRRVMLRRSFDTSAPKVNSRPSLKQDGRRCHIRQRTRSDGIWYLNSEL